MFRCLGFLAPNVHKEKHRREKEKKKKRKEKKKKKRKDKKTGKKKSSTKKSVPKIGRFSGGGGGFRSKARFYPPLNRGNPSHTTSKRRLLVTGTGTPRSLKNKFVATRPPPSQQPGLPHSPMVAKMSSGRAHQQVREEGETTSDERGECGRTEGKTEQKRRKAPRRTGCPPWDRTLTKARWKRRRNVPQ